MEKNNITYDSNLVYTCKNVTFEEGKEFERRIATEQPDVDGVLDYFNEAKIAVPEQVKIIGFSNWFMSQVITPKLSTVDQPSYEMGLESFNLLLEEMQCKKDLLPFKFKTIKLETSIIIRESSVGLL